jgi:hypothetical protein
VENNSISNEIGTFADVVKYRRECRRFHYLVENRSIPGGRKKQEISLMTSFRGSLADLQSFVARCSIPGEWTLHKKSGFYRFRSTSGQILNWWPSTRTINFQGIDPKQFEALLLSHASAGASKHTMELLPDEPAWTKLPAPGLQHAGTWEARGPALGAENSQDLTLRPSLCLDARAVKLLAAPEGD